MKIINILFILGILTSCASTEQKFALSDCVKGNYFTFFIHDVVEPEYTTDGIYKLLVVAPKKSKYYNTYFQEKFKIAHKAYKRVMCPNGI